MKRVYDPEQLRIQSMQKLYKSQSQKSFDYTLDDFENCGGCWKHKDWKVWMKGHSSYAKTQEIIKRYIAECKKPYGKRNLSEFHLCKDN